MVFGHLLIIINNENGSFIPQLQGFCKKKTNVQPNYHEEKFVPNILFKILSFTCQVGWRETVIPKHKGLPHQPPQKNVDTRAVNEGD